MTAKNWTLVLCAVFGMVGLVILPFQKMYEHFGLLNYSRMAASLTRTVIILSVVLLISKKFNFFDFIGISVSKTRNIALLLFPFFYPGILGYSKLGNSCPEHFAIPMVFSTFAAAMNEEIIFRGFIQGYLIKKTNLSFHRIFLITNFFFASGHFLSLRLADVMSVLNQVIFAYCIGLLLSAIQLRVNNVWLLGLTHGAINLILGSCSSTATMVEETSAGIIDIFIGMGSALLIFSPTLLIYWMLMKGLNREINEPTTINNE